ncbi:ketopantoate reductase-like protein [Roridomyces roridus]|uniref:Ketopantoate reductase-like protein n=1 Tax=Roridomyces roridus TaxID=1738132 RepID=A0AAD7FPV0_9AGAR|nr:ketopantoate reductase-like protein [Roridomyces roridus]
MQFHVLGLGPLGSLIAHHLRRAISPSHSITLLYSKASVLRRAPNALHVETAGALSSSSGFVYETFEPPATPQAVSQGPIESLLVTTRLNNTLHAIRRLLPRLSPNSTIVLVQNGLGVYEQLCQNLFRNAHERPHFIFATSTHATLFPSPSALYAGRPTLLQSAVGDIEFSIAPDPNGRNFESGLLDQTVHASERRPRLSDIAVPEGDHLFHRYRSLRNTVAALLLAEPLNARWKSMAHVQLALRRQVAVKSVIHPLTAIMGCRNGDVFSTPHAMRLAAKLCQETSDVYRAQIRDEAEAWLADNEGQSTSLLGLARLPRVLETESLTRECLNAAQSSPMTISTMLAAVRHGRRTEVDYLNGYLARLGKTYGVQMPTHAAMYNLVRMRSAVPQVLDKIF